jgi:hypothetical protein
VRRGIMIPKKEDRSKKKRTGTKAAEDGMQRRSKTFSSKIDIPK